jgi:hypothetical protein
VGLKRPRARRRLARGSGSLERGGDSPGGGDSPERGGVKPSREAETSWCGAWPSSEAEVRPRGTAASCLMGCYSVLGCGPFSALGRDHEGCVLWFVGLFVRFLLFLERGVFPRY